MPRGKKKSKSGGLLCQQEDSNFASEEESLADSCSVISNLSELRLGSEDDDTITETEDDVVITDDFEDRLKEAIEGTLQKSAKGRVSCLGLIIRSLTSKYMFDFLSDRIITTSDVVERSLKRGKGEEQILGASLAALLCIHLGSGDESETVFKSLQPILQVLLADTSVSPTVRAQCASSLGLCCFISSSGPEDIQATMDSLHAVFSGSFFKGNGVVPIVKPEISSLHSSALLAWTLLLTVLSPPYIMDLVKIHLRKLPQLLDSVDVDLRIAAGECLAVFYELGRQCRENFKGYDTDSLCDKLHLLATDGQKFRAKKDRRLQRSSFRDILGTIEDQEPLDIRVKFGKAETLYIDNWCHKRQYDALCKILGSGMNLHLKENELLRDIFELGAPLIEENCKVTKLEKHSAHVAAFKSRTKVMKKLRDKRADVVS